MAKVDLMKLPGWSVIVRAQFLDQGDLPVPEKFEIDPDEMNVTLAATGDGATLDQLSAYVATLNEPDLVIWAVGDLGEPANGPLYYAAGPLGQGLHVAVDELFMMIGG